MDKKEFDKVRTEQCLRTVFYWTELFKSAYRSKQDECFSSKCNIRTWL